MTNKMWVEQSHGFELKTDHFLIYFGKAKTTLDDLYKLYPNLIFKSLHQIHSDTCVNARDISTPLPQADALYTSDVGVALVIKTADCMPIMVFDQTSKKILAIHAGWKGVVNEITAKSIQAAHLKDVHVYIGPHITQKSFEVKPDAETLLRSVYRKYSEHFQKLEQKEQLETEIFTTFENDKFKIDLIKIVEAQIQFASTKYVLDTLLIDTVTDLRFNSYRRNNKSPDRNLSFIALLK